MRLYVNGQDIRTIVLGVDVSGDWEVQTIEKEPAGFLSAIDAFLAERGIKKRTIKQLIVVKGPGSSTALRTALTIANTWHFVRGIPILGVEKEPDASDLDVLNTIIVQEENNDGQDLVSPTYSHEPRITPTKRDALKRRTT